MGLKSVVNALPWHLRRTLRTAVRNWRVRHPPFAGVYARFSDVPSSVDPFIGSWWAEVTANRARYARNMPKPLGIPDLNAESKSLLPLAIALLGPGVRVLDFGGGAGRDFAFVRAACGQVAMNYTLVDFAETCAAGREIWSDDSAISFVAELPTDGTFDLVCAWSAIQYIENVPELLTRFSSYGPKAILIQETAFAQKAFVRGQKNTVTPTPLWVLSLPEIEAHMASLGYRLAFKSWGDADYNVDNFDPAYQVGSTPNLLFVRD